MLLGAVPTAGIGIQQLRFASDDRVVSVSTEAVRTWAVPDRAGEDLLERTGAWTNLRMCRDSYQVVAVLPYPDPTSAWAPPEACPSADDGAPDG